MKSNKYGFTLIEIMMVVAIIGIIFSVAGPPISHLISEVNAMVVIEDMQNTAKMFQTMLINEGTSYMLFEEDPEFIKKLKENSLPLNFSEKPMGRYKLYYEVSQWTDPSGTVFIYGIMISFTDFVPGGEVGHLSLGHKKDGSYAEYWSFVTNAETEKSPGYQALLSYCRKQGILGENEIEHFFSWD